MIKNFQMLSGFATQLSGVSNKVFEFTEGFNCLYGPNGSGKSTVLKTIKAYSAIKQGGWSKLSKEIELPASDPSHFPHSYTTFSPGNCSANVDWDGTPSFFNEGDVKVDGMSWFFDDSKLSEDGITTGDEQLEYMAEKPSSGQYRMKKLNKIFNMLENPPRLTGTTSEAKYIKTLTRNGKVSVLLDEPERALSLPKQMELFELLSEMSKDYQIIVATHCPFILFQDDVKIFDFEDGYSQTCLDIFKNCVKTYLQRKYSKE